MTDAFINGLAIHVHYIRQKLLENNELTVNEAFYRSKALYQAQEYSAIYTSAKDLVTASVAHTGDESEAPDLAATSTNDVVAITAFSGKSIFLWTYLSSTINLSRQRGSLLFF